MAEAARGRDVQPRELSFNGARQTIREIEQTHLYEPKQIAVDFPVLLALIAQNGSAIDRIDMNLEQSNRRTEASTAPHDVASRG